MILTAGESDRADGVTMTPFTADVCDVRLTSRDSDCFSALQYTSSQQFISIINKNVLNNKLSTKTHH